MMNQPNDLSKIFHEEADAIDVLTNMTDTVSDNPRVIDELKMMTRTATNSGNDDKTINSVDSKVELDVEIIPEVPKAEYKVMDSKTKPINKKMMNHINMLRAMMAGQMGNAKFGLKQPTPRRKFPQNIQDQVKTTAVTKRERRAARNLRNQAL